MPYVPTDTYIFLRRANCSVSIHALRNLSGDRSASVPIPSGVGGGKRKFESTSGWAPSKGSRWTENTWHMGTVTEFKFGVECMLCTVILCNLNLVFAVIMRRVYIRFPGGEQAVQLATLPRPIWLWRIFIFLKAKKFTNWVLPPSLESSLSVPTAPFELGNMAWPMVLGHSDQGGPSWTILLHVLNGWLRRPGEMEDHIQTYSQGAGMPSGARKQGLGRHIWTNLLTRVTFVFLAKLFEFGTYFPIWEVIIYICVYLRYFLLRLCLATWKGKGSQRVMIPMRVGLLSNQNSCGFSRTIFFLLLNMEPLLKVMCGFSLCKLYIYFACLRFYFSNSLLAVSYNGNVRLRQMLTVNQAGLCWIPVV